MALRYVEPRYNALQANKPASEFSMPTIGEYSSASDSLDEAVGVVALVGQDGASLDVGEQRLGLCDVVRLTGRDRYGDGQAERIDDGVDLRAQAAARTADGLVVGIVFF